MTMEGGTLESVFVWVVVLWCSWGEVTPQKWSSAMLIQRWFFQNRCHPKCNDIFVHHCECSMTVFKKPSLDVSVQRRFLKKLSLKSAPLIFATSVSCSFSLSHWPSPSHSNHNHKKNQCHSLLTNNAHPTSPQTNSTTTLTVPEKPQV